MAEARLKFEHGHAAKYLSEAIGAVRARLEKEMEAAGGIIKRESVDAETVAYFKQSNVARRDALEELRVVEEEAMRAAFDAFKRSKNSAKIEASSIL